MDIIKARDMDPTAAMITMVLAPPGMGKSKFASTVGDVVPPEEVLLIATLAREVKSWGYQEMDFDTVLIEEDGGWDPLRKKYDANAYRALVKLLDELVKDKKYSAVIIDNGTEASEYAWHDSLAPLKIGDPNELGQGGNRFAPYTSVRERMENMILRCNRLTSVGAARPKHIIIPWHVQPPKEDEMSKKGVEYVGSEIPMVRGGFRRRVAQKIDVVVYMYREVTTDEATLKEKMAYKLQVAPDMDRHTKIPGQVPPGVKFIEPEYGKLLELIKDSVQVR